MSTPLPDHPRIQGYRLLRRLGEGASGEVFLAEDPRLERQVALKLLRRDHTDQVALERFGREAGLLARFPHPGLVPILDLDLEHPPPYVVLAYMPGGDLAGVLEAEGAMEPLEVARLGVRLADALAHLHGHEILHRDVKLENVLLDEAGEPALTDLGLALAQGSSKLTGTGHLVGTLRYLAPELLEYGEYSPATDVFALGVLLAELAAGERLPGLAALGTGAQDLAGRAPHGGLRRVLRYAVRSRPEARLRQAAALRDELEALLARPTGEASGPLPALGSSPTQEIVVRPRAASRSLPLALVPMALLLTLGTCLLQPRGLATAPPPVGETAPGPGADLLPGRDPGLTQALEREFEAALGGRWDSEGRRSAGEGEYGFADALTKFGAVLLDELPVQRRVMDQLARRPLLEPLPLDLVALLRRHDRSWVELGLPPPFRPFLDLLGSEADTGLVPPFPTPREDFQVGGWDPPPRDHPAFRWWRRARVALHEGAARRWRAESSHQRGELELGPSQVNTEKVAIFTGREPGNLGLLLGALRRDRAGRDQLREFVAVGREEARDYLLAAALALEQADLPDPDAHVLGAARGFLFLQPFMLGTMLSAPRDRLFGGAGSTVAALEFQARIFERLAVLQERSIFYREGFRDPTVALWSEAFEAAAMQGAGPRAARLWSRLLLALDTRRQARGFLATYQDWSPQLLGLLDERTRGDLAERRARVQGELPGAGAGGS